MKAWTASELRALRKIATTWFELHGRPLPWRLTHDPYRIWISEIMLQQTQVATVIPYYHRFLERFPDVASLARSPIDDVLFLWAGLGYYRRARQLHRAAIEVLENYDGHFPTQMDEVLQLPGIGRYTAGAIMSFAYDARYPIVEANTQRLFARLIGLTIPPSSTRGQELLWEFAESVLPTTGEGSGRINQSLMEIGSQICTPKAPGCDTCPLQQRCSAFANQAQEKIPIAKPPKIYTPLTEASMVIRDRNGRWLLYQCTESDRWAGLWDFPRIDITGCTSPSHARNALISGFENKFSSSIDIGECLHTFRHAVTRYRITLQCYEATLLGRAKSGLRWFTRNEIDGLAICSSGKKLWGWLKKQEDDTSLADS